ncbi:class I SAM-dependent methyltransferase [Inhella proteolytica]|uniref:Class I SAM-dependent methyltransferase n=1 Tax=Inhella proteolytica TaxID=2795029 RepID=A0A931J4E6_9BURK|nr:class I SAM-dependent methyltransferase [Inhella proteolytica]MBH9575955.1 class I SAM-dependent methyltransferase [Inhella proteolytica]
MSDSPYSAGLARFFIAVADGARAQKSFDALHSLLSPGAAVLEIGTGLGLLAQRLAAAGHPVWALEPDADMRTVLLAQWQLQPPQAQARLTPLPWVAAADTPDLPEPVHLACAFSLLHLLAPAARHGLLTWAWRQLRPGGRLVLELPVRSPQRQAGDWQLYTELPIGASRLRMETRLQGSDAEGWCTHWRFEQRLGEQLGEQLIDQGERSWHWQAFAPEAAPWAELPGWEFEAEASDESGAPFEPGLSARRFVRLRKG